MRITGEIKKSRGKPELLKHWSYKTIYKDPYDPRYYVSIDVFVPIPDKDNPFPCIMVYIYNPKGRVFFRILDLKELSSFVYIDPGEVDNCILAMKLANNEANKILEANRELEHRKRLPEGMRSAYYNEKTKEVIDPDTGEVLKEAKTPYIV